jgi:hypothetical protein
MGLGGLAKATLTAQSTLVLPPAAPLVRNEEFIGRLVSLENDVENVT